MMADKREPSADTILWIRSTTVSPDEIARRLGRANDRRIPARFPQSRTTWAADLESDDQVPIGEQLPEAERFLADHAEALAELATECEITLSLGWSQMTPEEGAEETSVVIGPSLAGLLHRVGASVAIRVFTGPDA